jgi:hypothetical protein
MNNEISPAFITMFNEADKKLERQFRSAANLRDYAKTIMSISSIIVSLFATLKIISISPCQMSPSYSHLIILLIALYGILMIFSIIAIRPFPLRHGIEATLENYNEAFANKNDEDILCVKIIKYIEAIEENEKIIKWQSIFTIIAGLFLAAIVIIILIIAATVLS